MAFLTRSTAPVWAQTFVEPYRASRPVLLERLGAWSANCLRPMQLARRDDVSQLSPHFFYFGAAD
eukprot:1720839-Pyramimonas_sp.AAC.1